MRGSLSGCKVDADTSIYSAKPREQKTAEKEYISKHKRMSKSTKGKKGIVCTSSNSRHRIQPLSLGLFSLMKCEHWPSLEHLQFTKEEQKSQAKKQRKAYRTSKYRKRNLPSEALAAFRYSMHSLPKATNFLIKFCPQIVHEYQHAKVEVNVPVYSCTSSEELVD
jgi:hypothetical protein